jgi:hypothetical protein
MKFIAGCNSMTENLKTIEKAVKAIKFTSKEENHINISCEELKKNIEKALELIPGYFENIKIIKTLKKCYININELELHSTQSVIKNTFNETQNYVVENLAKIKLY